jgi:hypothetical protein
VQAEAGAGHSNCCRLDSAVTLTAADPLLWWLWRGLCVGRNEAAWTAKLQTHPTACFGGILGVGRQGWPPHSSVRLATPGMQQLYVGSGFLVCLV